MLQFISNFLFQISSFILFEYVKYKQLSVEITLTLKPNIRIKMFSLFVNVPLSFFQNKNYNSVSHRHDGSRPQANKKDP
jgi:hypothetical protein